MTAEILIPVALAALLLVFVLSLLLRRRPKRSARLVTASLESVSPARVDQEIAPLSAKAQPKAPPQKKAQARKAVASPAVAKISEPVASKPIKVAQPTPVVEDSFLPTLTPTPVAATSARASVPAQSAAPKFVVQSPLKSEAPSRKTKAVAIPPSAKPTAKPIAEPAEDQTPASDKVVDITTAISVRAPQKPKISRSALPEEIRAGLAKLNQRIDRLEDAVLDLENQLEDFDLDFSQSAKPAATVSSSPAEDKVEAEVEAEAEAKSETDAVNSDRDDKTIAA